MSDKRDKSLSVLTSVIAVLTYKSVETCLEIGGSQSWSLNRANAKSREYAVLCRNAKHPDVEGTEPHGSAFVVGRIADIVPSTETKDRWLLTFTDYAIVDVPNAWKGWRNPVAYTTFKDLGVDPTTLKFKPMPPHSTTSPATPRTPSPGELTIEQAKMGLAAHFHVKPEAVEIIIRG